MLKCQLADLVTNTLAVLTILNHTDFTKLVGQSRIELQIYRNTYTAKDMQYASTSNLSVKSC